MRASEGQTFLQNKGIMIPCVKVDKCQSEMRKCVSRSWFSKLKISKMVRESQTFWLLVEKKKKGIFLHVEYKPCIHTYVCIVFATVCKGIQLIATSTSQDGDTYYLISLYSSGN